jgi:hypothetical protein
MGAGFFRKRLHRLSSLFLAQEPWSGKPSPDHRAEKI